LPATRRSAGASPRTPAALRAGDRRYLGLAIGDALGATVEFMTPAEIRLQYGVPDEILGVAGCA
jgi:ADP-ribosyl-[dinitrogen reductase] hydrolase